MRKYLEGIRRDKAISNMVFDVGAYAAALLVQAKGDVASKKEIIRQCYSYLYDAYPYRISEKMIAEALVIANERWPILEVYRKQSLIVQRTEIGARTASSFNAPMGTQTMNVFGYQTQSKFEAFVHDVLTKYGFNFDAEVLMQKPSGVWYRVDLFIYAKQNRQGYYAEIDGLERGMSYVNERPHVTTRFTRLPTHKVALEQWVLMQIAYGFAFARSPLHLPSHVGFTTL